MDGLAIKSLMSDTYTAVGCFNLSLSGAQYSFCFGLRSSLFCKELLFVLSTDMVCTMVIRVLLFPSLLSGHRGNMDIHC